MRSLPVASSRSFFHDFGKIHKKNQRFRERVGIWICHYDSRKNPAKRPARNSNCQSRFPANCTRIHFSDDYANNPGSYIIEISNCSLTNIKSGSNNNCSVSVTANGKITFEVIDSSGTEEMTADGYFTADMSIGGQVVGTGIEFAIEMSHY